MTFKNLPLDRALIETSIQNYSGLSKVSYEYANGNKYVCKATAIGQKEEAIINAFYNSNGKTTLQAQGRNIALGTMIIERIIEECSVAVASKDALSIRGLKQDDFDLLLEYLTEECDAEVEFTAIPYGKKYTVQGCQGDNVTLTYYDNSTFMMQGCPVLLHAQIIEFLSNILELESIVQSQLNLIAVPLDSKVVLEEMSGQLPLSFEHLQPQIKALISPSIALSKLDLELDDYTVIAFPALRGLEAYIKNLYREKGIVIGRAGFAPHLNEEYHATLSDRARETIGCEKTCTAINQCYAYYKDERHGLFHASGILANTRMLSARQDAVNVVSEVLRRIEEANNLIRG